MSERKVKVGTEIALKLFIFTSVFFLKLLTLGSLKFDLLQWASVFPSYWQVVTMPARRLHTCSCGRSCLCDWRTPWGKSICCLIIYWTGLQSGWCRVGKFKKKSGLKSYCKTNAVYVVLLATENIWIFLNRSVFCLELFIVCLVKWGFIFFCLMLSICPNLDPR